MITRMRISNTLLKGSAPFYFLLCSTQSLIRVRDKSEPSHKAATKKLGSSAERPVHRCASFCGNCLCCVSRVDHFCEMYKKLKKRLKSYCQDVRSKLTEKLQEFKTRWKTKMPSVKVCCLESCERQSETCCCRKWGRVGLASHPLQTFFRLVTQSYLPCER